MLARIIQGAFIGAVIVFLWSTSAWDILGIYDKTLNKFEDATAVSTVILENAPRDGDYYIRSEDLGEFQMFATIKLKADVKMYERYLFSFLTQFVASGLITYILLRSKGSYGEKVFQSVILALISWVLVSLPRWNWMGASLEPLVTWLFILVVGWFLAGLVLAKITKN